VDVYIFECLLVSVVLLFIFTALLSACQAHLCAYSVCSVYLMLLHYHSVLVCFGHFIADSARYIVLSK